MNVCILELGFHFIFVVNGNLIVCNCTRTLHSSSESEYTIHWCVLQKPLCYIPQRWQDSKMCTNLPLSSVPKTFQLRPIERVLGFCPWRCMLLWHRCSRCHHTQCGSLSQTVEPCLTLHTNWHFNEVHCSNGFLVHLRHTKSNIFKLW